MKRRPFIAQAMSVLLSAAMVVPAWAAAPNCCCAQPREQVAESSCPHCKQKPPVAPAPKHRCCAGPRQAISRAARPAMALEHKCECFKHAAVAVVSAVASRSEIRTHQTGSSEFVQPVRRPLSPSEFSAVVQHSGGLEALPLRLNVWHCVWLV